MEIFLFLDETMDSDIESNKNQQGSHLEMKERMIRNADSPLGHIHDVSRNEEDL